MKIDEKRNYCILSNDITDKFLSNFGNITMINDLNFDKLKQQLEFFPSKQVLFNQTWYNLREKEIEEIVKLLEVQNIKYVNVTSNIEEAIYSEYIIVYDGEKKVLEGTRDKVLKEEKTLKKLGFGLPFVVDLSTQLNYYDVLDKVFYDIPSLAGELWN